MNGTSILVVDDDPQIRRVMRTTLIARGFEVNDARSGPEALDRLRSENYDLVLLDVKMPGMTGIETCRAIRGGSDAAIIVLSVCNTTKDKTAAFEAGADDYMTKPFSTPELLARIQAALRRKARSVKIQRGPLKLGDTQIDFDARRVRTGRDERRLTPKEFALLSYLASHANQIVTHRELLQEVWGVDSGDEKEYLRVFVNRLRKKIERSPDTPEYLITEPWVGYRFRLPE
jgi:two-component system KDP operon response regulator KdpE